MEQDDHKPPEEMLVYDPDQYTLTYSYDSEQDEWIVSCKEIPTMQAIGKTRVLAACNFIKLILGIK